MDVITAVDEQSGETTGYYHLLNKYETESVCGTVNEDALESGHTHKILSRSDAEQRGLQPCDRCMTYTGTR
ncbi:hypothetical protein [Haladaptatus halobius]|uniref:hypothetical protein n=1 Tax=Haladaptatus halobius TaxID=2884875 RepID=UPI001D0AB356|nr:hypothetical protein [Haladaptatus halobius]